MKLCPDCTSNPAPDQRSQAKDGRCSPCLWKLKRERARREREASDVAATYPAGTE